MLGTYLQKHLKKLGSKKKNNRPEDDDPPLEDHIILIGYGPAGRSLARIFEDAGIPFIVIELNPSSVNEMHNHGMNAIYGDASRTHILEHADIYNAKLCVIAINEPDINPRIINLAKYLNPTIEVIVRTRYISDADKLIKSGADHVVPEEMETTVQLFTWVLNSYLIPDETAQRYVKELRYEDYQILRGSMQEAHLMVLEGLDEEGLHTRAVQVRNGAFAVGKTLAELKLRNNYEITVLTIKRGNKSIGNPSGDFEIEAGDRLMMVASAERFASAAKIFRDEHLPEGFELSAT